MHISSNSHKYIHNLHVAYHVLTMPSVDTLATYIHITHSSLHSRVAQYTHPGWLIFLLIVRIVQVKLTLVFSALIFFTILYNFL